MLWIILHYCLCSPKDAKLLCWKIIDARTNENNMWGVYHNEEHKFFKNTEQSVTFCDHLWNPILYRRSFIVITWKRILLVSKEHVFNFLLFFVSFSYRFFCFLLVILYLLNISRSSGSTKPFAFSWLNVKSFPALIQMETLFFNRYYIPYCIFEIYWNNLKSNFPPSVLAAGSTA